MGESAISTASTSINLVSCDNEDHRQQFELIFDEMGEAASIKSLTADSCLEINACNTDDHAGVGTCCGCKTFKPDSTKACDFNMAWSLNGNGTITSVTSGK